MWMQGRYRILLSEDQTPEQHPGIARLLKQFPPDTKVTVKVWNEPLKYRVHTEGYDAIHEKGHRYAEIRAHGGKPKRSRWIALRPASAPSVPTLEQLIKRHAEAGKTLASARERLRENLKEQYRDGWTGSREWLGSEVVRRGRDRVIGRAVGRLLAIKGVHAKHASHVVMGRADYKMLDTAIGHNVDRESKVSERNKDRAGGYLGYIVKAHTGSYRFGAEKSEARKMPEHDNCITSYVKVKTEVEYLAELVRLSQERRPEE